jgi:hypothetical protein
MHNREPMTAAMRKMLERARKTALALPEAVETEMFGHPTFRAGGKMFTLFGFEKGRATLCFKVGKKDQSLFLEDERFFKTPYVGQHGWVSLDLMAAKLNWEEIGELMKLSYRNNAPKRLAGRV